MEQGWIKLYRKSFDNALYFAERFNKFQAWVDLLLLANPKPNKIFIRGIDVDIKRGQLAYSKKSLAKRWKWNERTVTKFLDLLQDMDMVHTKTSNVTTLISITNYDLYQGFTNHNTEQPQTKAQTDKNEKNNPNEKKKGADGVDHEETLSKEEVKEENKRLEPDIFDLIKDFLLNS